VRWPPLAVEQILAWADAQFAARGARDRTRLPPLSEARILAWADAHHAVHGDWPLAGSGPIPGSGGETWGVVDAALREGERGLPGGATLVGLLRARRGRQDRKRTAPPLSVERILAWSDEHRARTGGWPAKDSGAIAAAPGETWAAIDIALMRGTRGLPGGSSLAKLLAAERQAQNPTNRAPLTITGILARADSWHEREGRWPSVAAGSVPEAAGESWRAIDGALRKGTRGLPGGRTTLADLFKQAQPPAASEGDTNPAPDQAR
jgi:hypothetical protein